MAVTAVLVSILAGLSLFIYYYISRRLSHWKRKDVPHIEPEFFYGNARGVNTTIFSGHFFRDMYFKLKDKGPLVGLYLFIEPVAMVVDLDLVKAVLVKDFNKLPNRDGYLNEKDDPVSANLAAVENDRWKVLRAKLTPTFTSGKIKMMFPIISDVTDKLIDKIAEESHNRSIEVKDIHSRFTVDVIGKVAFGIECNSLDDSSTKFYQMGLKAFSSLTFLKRLLTTSYPEIAKSLHVRSSDPEVAGFYKDIVEQTIKYRMENNVQSNDFMSMLIKMMKENTLTFNEVWAQSVVFFLAGFETTATTLTYAIYAMAQRKDLQEKARESVKKVLEKYDGEFTYEAVNEMQYIEQCINGEDDENN
jgi:cytochrome P450 family 6